MARGTVPAASASASATSYEYGEVERRRGGEAAVCTPTAPGPAAAARKSTTVLLYQNEANAPLLAEGDSAVVTAPAFRIGTQGARCHRAPGYVPQENRTGIGSLNAFNGRLPTRFAPQPQLLQSRSARRNDFEPERGIEPLTCSLRVSRSTPELLRPAGPDVNPVCV